MGQKADKNGRTEKYWMSVQAGRLNRLTGAVCMVLSALLLGGCGGTELENKSFPLAVLAAQEKDECLVCYLSQNLSDVADENTNASNLTVASAAGSTYYEAQKTFEKNNRCQLDLSHTKALVFRKDFVENGSLGLFLDTVRRENIYARNTLVFLTDSSLKDMAELNGSLDVPLGSYLEQMMENEQDMEEQAAVTLGTLLNEQANAARTILLPVLKAEGGMPVIQNYEVLQESAPKGRIEAGQAQIYYLLAGQLKQLDLHLTEDTQVRLSRIKCRRKFEASGGQVEQQLILTAEAETISGSATEAETARLLQDMIEETCRVIKEEKQVDITDSRRHLAVQMPDVYRQYEDSAASYCENLASRAQARVHLTGQGEG